MQVAPPMQLVHWWLSKTDEDRQAILLSPSTSETARQNILVVEHYARQHCYYIACQTNLQVHALPPLVPLPRSLFLRALVPQLRLPSPAPDSCGGRYATAAQRAARQASAQGIAREVRARTEVLLRDYYGAGGADEWCGRAAHVIVEALLEASLAAVCRLGLADAIERTEREAVAQPPRDQKQQQKQQNQQRFVGPAPKPVDARRAEAYGCLGVWMLLASGENGNGSVVNTSGVKRSWDTAEDMNNWRLLREQFASQHHSPSGEHVKNKDGDNDGSNGNGEVGQVVISHSSSNICITDLDLRFGIAKALKNRRDATTLRVPNITTTFQPKMKDDEMQTITSVCTMGTPECDEELHLFLRCLRVFHPELPVVVGCSSTMIQRHDSHSELVGSKVFTSFCEDPNIEWVPCLDPYTPIHRGRMERQRGVWYPSRHTDFMMEKSHLMERAMAFSQERRGTNGMLTVFLDCDVVLLGELPHIPPGAELALSPHQIQSRDEALFGRYNGGFVVASNPLIMYEWRRAARHSRYYDQAALEEVARKFSTSLYELPAQHNYGYWRFFQTERGPISEARRFSIEGVGERREKTLLYDGKPLRSIHTHFFLSSDKQGRDVRVFNGLMKKWIRVCTNVAPRRGLAVAAAVSPVCGAGVGYGEHLGYLRCFDSSFLCSKN